MVWRQSILAGQASIRRMPGIRPGGKVSQTGHQQDAISRVAGQRELAPPSKFSKLGGFNSSVFKTSGIMLPQASAADCGVCAKVFPNSRLRLVIFALAAPLAALLGAGLRLPIGLDSF